jgi:hypothetical protein
MLQSMRRRRYLEPGTQEAIRMQIPETRYARAGDLRLAYHRWGDGPPLLIIPDLVSSARSTARADHLP